MEKVNVWKCSFCKKTSFHKGAINKHERKCFYNPATRSCATCLWFSPLILGSEYAVQCYQGQIFKTLEDSSIILKTQCENWMDLNIFWNNATTDNQNEMSKNLIEGQEDFFKALQII